MRIVWAALVVASCGQAADLYLLPEHARPDPFGGIAAADRSAAPKPARTLAIEAARGGYVSCHIAVSLPEAGEYKLTVAGALPAELYREWFHFLPARKSYYPDALVPVKVPYASRMPEADNKIEGQTAQAFWMDVWIPAGAAPGVQRVELTLESGGQRASAALEVRVLDAAVPAGDVVAMDHNSYGTGWLAGQYRELSARLGARFYTSDEFFGLIHAHHRMFHEHRGIYHQLGYGHGGKVGPEFAPRLEGAGKAKRVADWSLYDRHYGPLLDGSAFAGSRLGARPILYVYLPINPEWPASFLAWGEPGYEREFVNVVREMERHFREKGWTKTKFELFFNHKKRYKAFPWDGDETRFPNDFPYFAEYRRLMQLAMPKSSPVEWVFRTDASWQMERQFKEQAGVINFWVLGGGMFGWYAEQLDMLKKRGDMVWTYGGTPAVDRPASAIAVDALRAWMLGVEGFVRWQTVAPGPDPWFKSDGGGETLVYPGGRFGVDAPLGSVRLKLQRNVLQDLALLDSLRVKRPLSELRSQAAQAFNGTKPEDWRAKRPALADTDPITWSNVTIDEAIPKDARFERNLDAAAWNRVRGATLKFVKEARP
jgi:hypothetical protein